jgi:hypothetical protein
MLRRMNQAMALLMLAIFLATLAVAPLHARAQSSDDDQDSIDLNSDQDDGFGDSDDGFGPTGQGDEDQNTEGGQYVDESQTGTRGVDLAGRAAQTRLKEDRNQMPQNLGWGAATGLLLGGWVALLNAGDNRSNLQNIGTGVVIGAVVGAFIGARYAFLPDLPVPQGASNDTPPANPTSKTTTTSPLIALDTHGLALGVRFDF